MPTPIYVLTATFEVNHYRGYFDPTDADTFLEAWGERSERGRTVASCTTKEAAVAAMRLLGLARQYQDFTSDRASWSDAPVALMPL
jgi:hypothetical protein